MSDQPDWIEFEIGSGHRGLDAIGADEILGDFLGLLKAIDRGMSPHGAEVVVWEIAGASMQSPLTIRLRGNGSQPVIAAIVAGISLLNSARDCPPHFTPDALDCVRQLVGHSGTYGLLPVVVAPANRIPIERVAAANAAWAMRALELQKPIRHEYGSLRGELRELRSSSRKRDTLCLVDRLTGEEIPCYVDEKLDPVVRKAWKRRVELTGRVEVNRTTRKKSIYVDQIRILRGRNELPQIEDLHGIDLTGGVESSEYIRNLRDDDED
jgi:hypothetical protein